MSNITYGAMQDPIEAASSFVDVPLDLLTRKEKVAIVNAGFDLDEDNSDFDTVNLPLTWAIGNISIDTLKNSSYDFDRYNFQECFDDLIFPGSTYLMRIDDGKKKEFSIVTSRELFKRFCVREEWLVFTDSFTSQFKEYYRKDKDGKHYSTISLTKINNDQAKKFGDGNAMEVFMDVRLQAITA